MRATCYFIFLIAVQCCSASVIDAELKLAFRGPVPTGSSTADVGRQSNRRGSLTCPEELGGTPWTCSSDFCGGEDMQIQVSVLSQTLRAASVNVRRRRWFPSFLAKLTRYIGTSPGLTAAPQFTTIATTQTNGQTLVATYALQTISSYASLRQAITTRVTKQQQPRMGKLGSRQLALSSWQAAWLGFSQVI